MLTDNFHIFEDAEALALNAAKFIKQKIDTCVAARANCRIALPGGTTPARCLQILAGFDLPWQNISWYMGDERCLPVGDSERNDSMVYKMLFDRQVEAIKKFHPIKAELGAEKAAQDYSALIKTFATFDIVILGMGEDGHTASLFPGNDALDKADLVLPVYNAPKTPSERVTLSLRTLSMAGLRIVLVSGKNKAAALKQIKSGEPLPVNSIGKNQWFIDKDAISQPDC